jgi:WD40 repeat protein
MQRLRRIASHAVTCLVGMQLIHLCAPASAAQLQLGQQPELFVQSGHTAVTVSAVAFSSNLQWLASGGSDGQVLLWNVLTGVEVRTLVGHKETVNVVALSADGRYVASAGVDKKLLLHDTKTGTIVKELGAGDQPVDALAISSNGRALTWGQGNMVIVWNSANPQPPSTVATLPGRVTALAFSNNSATIVAGSETGSAEILSVADRKPTLRLAGHVGEITSIAFSDDGARIVTGSFDKTVRIWSSSTGALLGSLSASKLVWSVAFAHSLEPPEQTGAAATKSSSPRLQLLSLETDPDDRVVHIVRWDGDSGHILSDSCAPMAISSGLFQFMVKWPNMLSGDGSRAAFASDFSTVTLWDVAKKQPEHSFTGITAAAFDVQVSPDHHRIAVASGKDIQVWSVQTGSAEIIHTGYARSIRSLAFNPKSDLIISVNDREELDVWNIATKKSVLRLRGSNPKYCDGKYVSEIDHGTVKLWSLDVIQLQRSSQPESFQISSVYGADRISMDANGKWLAAANQIAGEIHVFDVSGRSEKTSIENSGFHFLGPMRFSPDGNRLAWPSNDGSIGVLDIAKGKTYRFCCHRPHFATSLAFSSNGDLLASGGEDHEIKLWDLRTLADTKQEKPLATLQGHTGAVRSLSFIPGKRLLISASEDGSARIWDLDRQDEGAQLISLRNVPGWLVVTNKGLFDGTADAINYVSWHIPETNSVFPLQAFYNDFYHPGLMAEIIDGKHPTPCTDIAAILRVPGSRTMQLQRSLHVESRAGVLTLCLPERPELDFFQNVDVRWQGLPVPVQASSFQAGDRPGCDYELSLPKVSGPIELNASGVPFYRGHVNQCKSPPEKVSDRTTCTHGETGRGTLHVAIVAIGDYLPSSGYDPLSPSVLQDATDLESYFKNRAPKTGDSYTQINVRKPLLGRDATLQNIKTEFAAIIKEAKEDDEVLLFLSGHGSVPPGQEEFFFIPANGQFRRESETGLSTAMLVDFVRELPARRVLLVIDACQSGGVLDSLVKVAEAKAAADVRYAATQSDQARRDREQLGIHVLAAASPFQGALIVDGTDLFGTSLLTGLRDSTQQKTDICVSTLGKVISEALQRETSNLPKSQSSVLISKGVDFVVAANKSP